MILWQDTIELSNIRPFGYHIFQRAEGICGIDASGKGKGLVKYE